MGVVGVGGEDERVEEQGGEGEEERLETSKGGNTGLGLEEVRRRVRVRVGCLEAGE